MHFTPHLINNLLATWGYVAVLAFIFIESAGIPFPGETMLITAAAYAGAGHLDIPFVIMAGAGGAIMGDNLGFQIGRLGGRELALRYGRYVRLDAAKLDTAERFYARHGDKTVFLGRFVAILRAWSAFLAGLNRMRWIKFAIFDAAGGITWATLWGVLAFELGNHLTALTGAARDVGIVGVVTVVVVAAVILFLRRRGARAEREMVGSEEAGVKDQTEVRR